MFVGNAIGARIKAERKKKGLTQKDLADALGIHYVNISQWENGKRKPKLETIRRIADVLDVTDANLLGFEMAYSMPFDMSDVVRTLESALQIQSTSQNTKKESIDLDLQRFAEQTEDMKEQLETITTQISETSKLIAEAALKTLEQTKELRNLFNSLSDEDKEEIILLMKIKANRNKKPREDATSTSEEER